MRSLKKCFLYPVYRFHDLLFSDIDSARGRLHSRSWPHLSNCNPRQDPTAAKELVSKYETWDWSEMWVKGEMQHGNYGFRMYRDDGFDGLQF